MSTTEDKGGIAKKVIDLYLGGMLKTAIAKETKLSIVQVSDIIDLSAVGNRQKSENKPRATARKDLTEGKREIKINDKTWVWIRPDQDEDEVRERWLNVINRNKFLI